MMLNTNTGMIVMYSNCRPTAMIVFSVATYCCRKVPHRCKGQRRGDAAGTEV